MNARRPATAGAAIAGALLLVTVLAGPAAAKGPFEVTIAGPGLDEPIVVDASGDASANSTLHWLMDATGLWAALAPTGQVAATVPAGDLGPAYTVTWRMAGPSDDDRLVQTLHPFADAGPVTHTASDQHGLGSVTRETWKDGGRGLRDALTRIGFPETPPASAPRWPLPVVVAVVVLAAAVAVPHVRRRTVVRRGAPAADSV